jgi:polysaccharide deacetylase family protein (PEP-CTERM system associated)
MADPNHDRKGGQPSMQPAETGPIRIALTVDVEDYFHVTAFRGTLRHEDWSRLESRVVESTHKLLDLLDAFDVQATFFVLGWVADRYPDLVRRIQRAGHELGCHSYAHRLVYEMTPGEFRADTRRALEAIEDASGTSVLMYRAPSFSITPRSLWAIEILLELGFVADSSISSVRTGLYGFEMAPRQPFRMRLQGKDLFEFPMTALKIGGWHFPVTGGVYLRLLPRFYQDLALAALAKRGEATMVYLHPWEFDPKQPRVAAPLRWRFIHYAGLRQTEARFRRLLTRFHFGRLSEWMRAPTPVCEVGPVGTSGSRSPAFRWLTDEFKPPLFPQQQSR